MVAAPALPPQVYVPERARTGSAAVRHRAGRPSTLHLVTTGRVTTAFAQPEGFVDAIDIHAIDQAFHDLPVSLPASRIHAASSPLVTAEAVSSSVQSIRLTLRGRITLAVLTTIGALSFLVFAHTGSSNATGASNGSLRAATSVTVHDGDTLWGIASRIDPGGDPRAVIGRIRSLNKLDTAALVAGQTLRLR